MCAGAEQRVPAQPDHHAPDAHRRRSTSARSARACRPSASSRSSWICSRCAAARRTWRLRPTHPGCIYGEMAMCLRPCQQVVGPAEYRNEVARVAEFLRTDGRSLLESIGHSRDRLSEEMMFEDAARQHKRYEKVQDVLRLRDELARDIDAAATASRSRAPSRRTRSNCGSSAAARGVRRSASTSRCRRASRSRWIRNCAKCWPRRARKANHARAPGVSGAACALVLLDLAGGRVAAASRDYERSRIASWSTRFRVAQARGQRL